MATRPPSRFTLPLDFNRDSIGLEPSPDATRSNNGEDHHASLQNGIVLELIQQEYPAFHERLRSNRMLLQAMNDYATALRSSHLTWMDELKQANPGFDESQLSSEALEMAIQALKEALPSEARWATARMGFPWATR